MTRSNTKKPILINVIDTNNLAETRKRKFYDTQDNNERVAKRYKKQMARKRLITSDSKISDSPSASSEGENEKKTIRFVYCNFPGCKSKRDCNKKEDDENRQIQFYRIPFPPGTGRDEDNPVQDTNFNRRKYEIRRALRRECLNRLGRDVNDKSMDLRICNEHEVAKITKNVAWTDLKGDTLFEPVRMFVPSNDGVESNLTNSSSKKKKPRDNGGVAASRARTRTIKEIEGQIEGGCEKAKWIWELNQAWDQTEWELLMDENQSRNSKSKFGYQYSGNRRRLDAEIEKTVLKIAGLDDDYIHETTGFKSKMSMLAFISVICKADLTKMFATVSQLTWFEEWVFYFQTIYGRKFRRWIDAEDHYKKSVRCLQRVFDCKLKIQLQSRDEWPRFVTLEEDLALRDNKWKAAYDGKRIIMWDNTALPIKQPSDAELQRNTYSAYYAGNVAKGGIFLQLCGWLGTEELWVGAVSDSEYFKRSGILEQQKQFVHKYDNKNAHIKWYNILDKGYKVGSAAWQQDGQLVLQPSFAKAEMKFNTFQTIRSGAIASDRSANERAVHVCKISNFLSDGLPENACHERWCDVWLAWSFQCNFMYSPVTGFSD